MPHIAVSGGWIAAQGRRAIVLAGALLLVFCALDAQAGNLVSIESKWVEAGASDIELGIYITNEDSLAGIVMPLEFRSIHVGSFITRALNIRANSRLAYLEDPDIQNSVIQKLYFPSKKPTGWIGSGDHCRPDSLGRIWEWSTRDSLPDFVGEEAFMYASVPFDLMPPGDDMLDSTTEPSFILSFDVTDVGGAFIIDTCCIRPGNHLAFVAPLGCCTHEVITPTFEPSVILIGCNSECHGDPNCDGQCNLVDLVRSIDVAFLNAPPAIDPDPRCPVENTDVNCDLRTDVLDIVKMINVQYRMLPAASEFCVPCDHIPRTGKPKDDVRTPYFRNNGS